MSAAPPRAPFRGLNALYARTLAIDAGGDELALTYDFAGNILRQELTNDGTDTTALRYTHDAWNQLVKVEFEDEEEDLHPRGEYEYNGLNWRTIARIDSDTTNATHALDELRTMYYSHEWRLLEVRVDANYQSSPGINSHIQHVWGERYIDDIVSTRHDPDPSAEDGYEVGHFHLTDAQFSTVALTGSDGAILERVSYTAYGVARHHWRGDVNGDGAVDSADLAIVFGAFGDSIDDAGYRAEADLFPDGTIDAADSAIVLGGWQSALPAGVLSSPLVDNRIGYCGYVFAPETQSYLVRHRWYLPPLGRWGQRDPAGYVDGMSLYEYVRSRASVLADPLGLDAVECPPNLKDRCHCRAVKIAVVSGGANPDFLKDIKGYFEVVGKAGYVLDLASGNVLGLAYSLGTAGVPAAVLDRIERHLKERSGVDIWIYTGNRCCRCGHWRWANLPGSAVPLKLPLHDCGDCRYYDEPAPQGRAAIRCRPPSRVGSLQLFERFLVEEAGNPSTILRCIRQAIDDCGDQLGIELAR